MSDYPNYASEPVITRYEGFEIAVSTGTHTWGHLTGQISASATILKDGVELANYSVAGGFPSAEEAAANALRQAKQAIFERFDGPNPDAE